MAVSERNEHESFGVEDGLDHPGSVIAEARAGPPGSRASDAPTPGVTLGATRPWGRGLAREASAELLRHGFEAVGVRRVIAQTMAVNTRSRAVMEVLGMRFVRRYDQMFDDPLPGTEAGEVEYEIDASDWLVRRGSASME